GLIDPALGSLLGTGLDADVVPSGDLDQLGAPADAADERLVPFLEEDTRAARQLGGVSLVATQVRRKLGRPRLALGGPPDDCTQDADDLKNLRHRALVEEVDRNASKRQLARDLRLQIGKAEHQVRFELENAIEFGIEKGADLGLLPGFRRT